MAVNAVKLTDALKVSLNAKMKEAFASAWLLDGHKGFYSYWVGAKSDTKAPPGAVLGSLGGGMFALFRQNEVFNHLVSVGTR